MALAGQLQDNLNRFRSLRLPPGLLAPCILRFDHVHVVLRASPGGLRTRSLQAHVCERCQLGTARSRQLARKAELPVGGSARSEGISSVTFDRSYLDLVVCSPPPAPLAPPHPKSMQSPVSLVVPELMKNLKPRLSGSSAQYGRCGSRTPPMRV